MKQYLQVAPSWLLDKESLDFVSVANKKVPCEIDIPSCLWTYGSTNIYRVASGFQNVNGELSNVYNVHTRVNEFKLTDLEVELTQYYKHANIMFKTARTGAWNMIALDVAPNFVNLTGSRGTMGRLYKGVTYQMKLGGSSRKDYISFDGVDKFKFIHGLAVHKETLCDKKIMYGLIPRQYIVTYKGRELGGKSFALVCGTWAVLLDDDFSFDSLVYLQGIKSGELEVAKFAYTLNPYVVKVITMWK